MNETKTIVRIDLFRYNDTVTILEENLGAQSITELNKSIQSFINKGIDATSRKREDVVKSTNGDGAVLLFNLPEEAHMFSGAVHENSVTHNSYVSSESAKRRFRIGVATGLLDEDVTNGSIAGGVISRALRLEEKANPGEVLIDSETYNLLPNEFKINYSLQEEVKGKRENEVYRAHRWEVYNVSESLRVHKASDSQSLYASERIPTDTIFSHDKVSNVTPLSSEKVTRRQIFDLFARLVPKDEQIDSLISLSDMPTEYRPSKRLNFISKRNAIIDWFSESDKGSGLDELARNLNFLISHQQRESQNP